MDLKIQLDLDFKYFIGEYHPGAAFLPRDQPNSKKSDFAVI